MSTGENAHERPLLAGFAKVDVTPPPAIPYLSYYPRQTPFEGVHDRLYARALAVEGPHPLPGPGPLGSAHSPASPTRGEGERMPRSSVVRNGGPHPLAPSPTGEGGRRPPAPRARGAHADACGGGSPGPAGALAARRAAIVAVDSLGLSRAVLGPGRDFIGEVRARIEARMGIPAANVLIAATHAHSTPQTTDIAPLVELFPYAAEWLERLIELLASAVQAAWASRTPATLRGATGLAPGIAWCRRIITRDGRIVRLQQRPVDDEVVKEPRDDRVPVLLVETETQRGALLGFTCHPTTVQVQPLVSADYPGVACAIVERELAAEACLFLQGACGNVGPVRATTDFQDAALYGRSLGGEALRVLALQQARDLAPMRPILAADIEIVEVERRPLPDAEALAPRVAELERAIAAAATDDARRAAIAVYRRPAEELRLAQLGGGPVRIEVQAIRLGATLIVACEGELFVEFGNQIKEASPAEVTFVAAYSNGYEGYLPTPETFDEGGYEASAGPWTRVWRTGGQVVTDRAIALARRVWAEGE